MKKYTPKTKKELQKLVNNLDIHLGDIDTSNITDMSNLFFNTLREDFSGIETWDVSKVIDMSGLFYGVNFNQDLSKWDVSKVKDMSDMFTKSKFNQDISNWDVSNVIDMKYMFSKSEFNQDISTWDVSNVENISNMFNGGIFTGDISMWNVSKVRDMSYLFANSKFNGDISSWDVNNVTNMIGVFYKSEFNIDISNWNVSNVKFMSSMFESSTFNQDISNWKLHKDCFSKDMFLNSKIKEYNKPRELQDKSIINYVKSIFKKQDIENFNDVKDVEDVKDNIKREIDVEMKTNVLEIEMKEVNDKYTAWWVTYMNKEILIEDMEDEDLGLSVGSGMLKSAFSLDRIMNLCLTTNEYYHHQPNIINTVHVPILKEKIREINEKYGVEKFEIERCEKEQRYYVIDTDFSVSWDTEGSKLINTLRYIALNYFKSEKEAKWCAKKMKEYLLQLRKEWRENNEN